MVWRADLTEALLAPRWRRKRRAEPSRGRARAHRGVRARRAGGDLPAPLRGARVARGRLRARRRRRRGTRGASRMRSAATTRGEPAAPRSSGRATRAVVIEVGRASWLRPPARRSSCPSTYGGIADGGVGSFVEAAGPGSGRPGPLEAVTPRDAAARPGRRRSGVARAPHGPTDDDEDADDRTRRSTEWLSEAARLFRRKTLTGSTRWPWAKATAPIVRLEAVTSGEDVELAPDTSP